MPFLFEFNINKETINILTNVANIKNNRHNDGTKMSKQGIPPIRLFCDQKGRVSYTTCNTSGSITLEAAIIIPIVIFAWTMIAQLMFMINIQSKIESSTIRQSLKAAGYSYLVDYAEHKIVSEELDEDIEYIYDIAKNGISEGLIKHMVISDLGEDFFSSGYIKDGTKGLDVIITPWVEEGIVDVILCYKMVPKYNLFGVPSMQMLSRARVKEWVGTTCVKIEKENDDGQTVYKTPSGTVYHTYRDCSYIAARVEAVELSKIHDKRNASFGKYYACEGCKGGAVNDGMVYVTLYGERYHTTRNCNKIYHNIIELDISKVEGLRLCSKCAKRNGDKNESD